MISQFFTIGILMILTSMLPGPDFALVAKNSILHSRRAGLYTSLGVGSAILIHITYCMLGLAIVISESIILFNLIKYIGAAYLIYLGITSLFSSSSDLVIKTPHADKTTISLSNSKAFRQGFLCNLLNPKATLFFLALFTVIIKPETPVLWEMIYAIEMFIIITTWFATLSFLLSHPSVLNRLNRVEKYIAKALGIFLIGFGLVLAFVKK